MNTNPPRDETICEDRLVVININRKDKNCLVRKENGGKSFVCEMAEWLIDGVELMDFVKVKTNHVTGKPVVTDYYINMAVYGPIHNSYQDRYEDMITDENGVPL